MERRRFLQWACLCASMPLEQLPELEKIQERVGIPGLKAIVAEAPQAATLRYVDRVLMDVYLPYMKASICNPRRQLFLTDICGSIEGVQGAPVLVQLDSHREDPC